MSDEDDIESVEAQELLEMEIDRLRAENERLRRVYDAANVVVAVLGYHGEICARDDRVSALMDALHGVDGGVPNANSASVDVK